MRSRSSLRVLPQTVEPCPCAFSKAVDAQTGFQVDETFERFNQKNDQFNRAWWDPEIKSERVRQFFDSYYTDRAKFRSVPGYTHKDFALRNSSWYIADFTADLFESTRDRREGFLDSYTMLRPGATARDCEGTPAENSARVKRAAKFLGADLVGICEFDERWVYTDNYSRRDSAEKEIDLPSDLPWVVVIANQMDREAIESVPSALSGAATGQGYSKDIIALLSLASFIENLGYRAVASLNDTALSIPIALQAGLGEYGRHGLLITREYGPRVRIAKLFTDMPLVADKPVRFGVREFCEVCKRCSRACPPKAIPSGEPQTQPISISNIRGVAKWTVNAEKCFKFWTNQGTDCSICIRVCPYNKDYSKLRFRIGQRLAATRLRRLMVWLDVKLGFGKRKDPRDWWRIK